MGLLTTKFKSCFQMLHFNQLGSTTGPVTSPAASGQEEMGEEKFLLGGNMLRKGSFGRKWVSKSSYCGEMDEEKFLLRGNGEEKFLFKELGEKNFLSGGNG